MTESDEPIESNDIECIILTRTGEIERVRNGTLGRHDKLPVRGDNYRIGSKDYQVIGHSYTPHLAATWHFFLQEVEE